MGKKSYWVSHLHQFTVYIKSTHRNFLDSLLQQYNFDANTTEAPAEVSEEATDTDEPEDEAATEPQAEVEHMLMTNMTNLKKRVSSLQLIVLRRRKRKSLRENSRSPQPRPPPNPGQSTLYKKRK